MRYACIDRRRSRYPVKEMCRLLNVSRSGYYAWRVRPECTRARQDRVLLKEIRIVHEESDGTYGARRVRMELNETGFACGRRKVAKLMRSAGLRGCPTKRYKGRSGGLPGGSAAPNLLQQDFTATEIDHRWVCDVTYVGTSQASCTSPWSWIFTLAVSSVGR